MKPTGAKSEQIAVVKRCADCGAPLGPPQTRRLIDDRVVCIACHSRLAPPVPAADSEPIRVGAHRAEFSGFKSEIAEDLATSIPPAPTPATGPINIHITVPATHHAGNSGRGLMLAGGIILACSVPLFCLFSPLGFTAFIVGLVLFIVGATK